MHETEGIMPWCKAISMTTTKSIFWKNSDINETGVNYLPSKSEVIYTRLLKDCPEIFPTKPTNFREDHFPYGFTASDKEIKSL